MQSVVLFLSTTLSSVSIHISHIRSKPNQLPTSTNLNMANRGQSWDSQVHSIADLREHGSRKLPKMYRDYYNEGAMDLVT